MAKIDTLAQYGEDAFGNHFVTTVPEFNKLGKTGDELALRITSISVPERAIETYEYTKNGKKHTRVKPESAQENAFTLSFRGDKNYRVYKKIIAWINYVQNNKTMAMASDCNSNKESDYRADFQVDAVNNLTEDQESVAAWTFEGAFPKSISGVDFDEESSEPISFDVSFECRDIGFPEDEEKETSEE